MFELTEEDKNYLHRQTSERAKTIRTDSGLLIRGSSKAPFYIQSKQSWLSFLKTGLKVPDSETRNKHLNNAAFRLCGIDFHITLLLDSIQCDGKSCLSPGIFHSIQQSIATDAHSILEGIGTYYFDQLKISKVKGVNTYVSGICEIIYAPPVSEKSYKKSDFSKLNRSRNRIHQDKLENRDEDYFARLDPQDLTLPVLALQKSIVSIWKRHPAKDDGEPKRLIKDSPFSCVDLVDVLETFSKKRFEDHKKYSNSDF